MKLERVFRAAIATASAIGCGELTPASDAGVPDDATTEVTTNVLDGSMWNVSDAYWCDAGPPVAVQGCGSCCGIVHEQCVIPPNEMTDAGWLGLCDDYCIGTGWQGCQVIELDGAASALPYVQCVCTGRHFSGFRARPWHSVGEWFASVAGLEAASIQAFRRLSDELQALDAPARLVRSARRSMLDEARHARLMARVARRLGASVTLPRARRFRRRSVEAIAKENAVEGCVRETYGALVGLWQSEHAGDERVRRAMRGIARDEMRHAMLAMRVAAFLEPRMTPRSRRRVAEARVRAIREVRATLAYDYPVELVRMAGLPTREQATALFGAIAYSLSSGLL